MRIWPTLFEVLSLNRNIIVKKQDIDYDKTDNRHQNQITEII